MKVQMREHVYLLSASQNYQRPALGQLTLGTTGTDEQVDGAAMGSPVSTVVANFEEVDLNSSPGKPVLQKRYVDDTFCIVKKGSGKRLLDHLNSVRPSI